jgi:hypothetical protein
MRKRALREQPRRRKGWRVSRILLWSLLPHRDAAATGPGRHSAPGASVSRLPDLFGPFLGVYPALLLVGLTGLTTCLSFELLAQLRFHDSADMAELAAGGLARVVPVQVRPPLALDSGLVFTGGLAPGGPDPG